jgi:hypothetical protein
MNRRSPTCAALLAIITAAVAQPATAQSQNAVSVTAIAASGALISFRAPEGEYDDCCSSFSYFMVIRGNTRAYTPAGLNHALLSFADPFTLKAWAGREVAGLPDLVEQIQLFGEHVLPKLH